jgi:hypothetical protein
MKEKMPPIWTLMTDNSGGFSSMRFILIFTTIFFLGIWGSVCYTTKKLEPFPREATTIILGLAGVKMAQRYGEKGELETSATPSEPTPETK